MARTVKNDESPVEDVDEPRLTVSGAARRLGIAPATLRTWDRRYGIGPTEHARGRHRRYSADDMARLELMQRALMQGAAPAEAARYARTVALPLRERAAKIDAVLTDGTAAVAEAPAPLRIAPVEVAPPSPVVRRARGGGGATLRMPGADARARGLGRAALAMDSIGRAAPRGGVHRGGRAGRHLGRGGAPGTRRRRGAVGDHRSRGGGRAPAQPVSRRGLRPGRRGFADAPAAPQPVRPVLLAAMPTELHVVPLAVLAALLAERGVGCRSLGAALPADALAAAVRRTAPAAVVLWSQLPSTADLGVVAGLPVTRPRYRTFVAGPGWNGAALPAGVGVLGSLVDAGERIGGAVLR